ncbi:hypothetical protein [Chryseobacterium jejuense]|uniref:hypothetical protein n=1 Tax=Chryseobacterium jejuense TaxID=445960 RepID=UPI00142893EF|nr:hypothetical protein [Chryseobacterium jejuense]
MNRRIWSSDFYFFRVKKQNLHHLDNLQAVLFSQILLISQVYKLSYAAYPLK